MGRLFDAGKRKQEIIDVKDAREGVRRRAEEVERIMAEELELSETSQALGEQMGAVQSVQTVQYSSFREPGSKWSIEHAQNGDDYIYQLFPLRVPKMDWRDVILLFIAAMDNIFPRSVVIRYVPPSQKFELKYYTIRVEKVTGLPGWEQAVRGRALPALAAADAWPL